MKTIILIISLCCCLWLQAGQVKITGKTTKTAATSKGRITINAVINGKKQRLCNSKRFKRDKSYTLKCSAQGQVEYITLATNSKDDDTGFWTVKTFIIELPNGDKWQFPGDTGLGTTIVCVRPLTFYFSGEFTGQMRFGKHGEKTKFWAKGKKLNAPASETTAKK